VAIAPESGCTQNQTAAKSKVEDKVHWFRTSSNEAGVISTTRVERHLYSSVAGLIPLKHIKMETFRISNLALTTIVRNRSRCIGEDAYTRIPEVVMEAEAVLIHIFKNIDFADTWPIPA